MSVRCSIPRDPWQDLGAGVRQVAGPTTTSSADSPVCRPTRPERIGSVLLAAMLGVWLLVAVCLLAPLV